MSGKFWTDAWSLVDGCTPVSEGCRSCWLRAIDNRFGRAWDGTVRFREDRLDIPLKARKPKVYAVWSDLFHHAITWESQLRAFTRMVKCPHHTFLIVTKRPRNAAVFAAHWGLIPDPLTGFTGSGEHIPDNVWLLVTMENQARADERMPWLLKWPGKRGILVEPMLGPVNLSGYDEYLLSDCGIRCPHGNCDECNDGFRRGMQDHLIHTVIAGAETGPGARPADLDGFRSLRDQCAAAGVSFYLKSTGKGRELDRVVHDALAWRKP